jgi:Ni/Co efflux regulator RcnB
MHLERKHFLSAVVLAAAVVVAPATMNAQPGHGGPPPGQAKHDFDRGRGPQGRPDFHFDQSRRDQFAQHYRNDAMRWRNNRRRPAFRPGYAIPRSYAIRPVPRSYWAGMQPPPPGYQYGYYDGYVVAYDPTTRIIADVMDLVTSFAR